MAPVGSTTFPAMLAVVYWARRRKGAQQRNTKITNCITANRGRNFTGVRLISLCLIRFFSSRKRKGKKFGSAVTFDLVPRVHRFEDTVTYFAVSDDLRKSVNFNSPALQRGVGTLAAHNLLIRPPRASAD